MNGVPKQILSQCVDLHVTPTTSAVIEKPIAHSTHAQHGIYSMHSAPFDAPCDAIPYSSTLSSARPPPGPPTSWYTCRVVAVPCPRPNARPPAVFEHSAHVTGFFSTELRQHPAASQEASVCRVRSHRLALGPCAPTSARARPTLHPSRRPLPPPRHQHPPISHSAAVAQ